MDKMTMERCTEISNEHNSHLNLAGDCETTTDALVVSQILNTKSPTSEENKIGRYQWFCMLLGTIMRGYRASFNGAFGVYYVQYLIYFDVSHATGSWMRTIEQAFGAVVGLLIGLQIDVIPARYVACVSLITLGLGFEAASFSPNITTLTWIYGIVIGSSSTCFSIATTVISQRSMPGKATLASTLELIGGSASLIVSPLLLDLMIRSYGWRWALRYHGIVALNLAPVAWILRTPNCKSPATANHTFCNKFLANMKGLRHLFINGPFVISLMANILYHFNLSVIMVHTVSMLVSFGYSSQTGSLFMTMLGAVVLVTRLCIIPCVHRMNALIVGSAARVVLSCGLLLTPFSSDLYIQVASMAINSMGIALSTPMITVVNVQLLGLSNLGKATTITNLGTCVSVFLGASCAAYLYEVSGSYRLPYLVAGGSGLVSAALLVLVHIITRCKRTDTEADTEQA